MKSNIQMFGSSGSFFSSSSPSFFLSPPSVAPICLDLVPVVVFIFLGGDGRRLPRKRDDPHHLPRHPLPRPHRQLPVPLTRGALDPCVAYSASHHFLRTRATVSCVVPVPAHPDGGLMCRAGPCWWLSVPARHGLGSSPCWNSTAQLPPLFKIEEHMERNRGGSMGGSC